ncbi:MAG TPA: DUF1592 domain-containing protein [Cyclobacteriaceae bacterium]
MLRSVFCATILVCLGISVSFSQEAGLYESKIRPLMDKKCFECHNTGNTKGGVNLDNYKEEERVISDGQFWLKVLEQIKMRDMPPNTKPPLSESEYTLLVGGIDSILQRSLQERKPGHIVIRRLSHTEYQYTVLDLLNIEFDAKNYFPSDGSGGGGFDNQGGSLFITPLKFERYYDAADAIIQQVYDNEALWTQLVPVRYRQTWWQQFRTWVKSLFSDNYEPINPPELAAQQVIVPFATKAFRRFLKEDEKTRLTDLFMSVYEQTDSLDNPRRFDESIAQAFKSILVSPHFLYRAEEEPPKKGAYPLSDFELATRLSYFLWSSMPDQELFSLAYIGKLQDTLVLASQVRRMLADPRAKRFAESFATQWLGVSKLLDNQEIVDPARYPELNMDIRKALYKETVEYFYYVLTGSKNMLELVNSNYTFVNEELAAYYGIEGVAGNAFRKIAVDNDARGGVLGMAGVLTTTSLPDRTSPVLRGKWVMEQILGISPPPPPPEVAELTKDASKQSEVGLRKLLEMHRSDPACFSCHQKMDPLGLGLENFDAIGRWRDSYGKAEIDPSGVLSDGQAFSGPEELKVLLLKEKQRIARNFSSRMLSYALGRSVLFTDEPALRRLETCLLENNFNPELFLVELVKSYPFRMKLNDFRKKVDEVI